MLPDLSPDPFFDEEREETEEEVDTGPPAELAADDPAFPIMEKIAECILRDRKLKAELKANNKELARLTAFGLRYFEAHPNISRVDAHGLALRTKEFLYPCPKKGSSRQEVIAALHSGGWGHFVREEFSTSALGTHIQALEDLNAERFESGEITDASALLPPELAAVLNITPITKIVGRRRPKS